MSEIIRWVHERLNDVSAFCGGGYNALVLVIVASGAGATILSIALERGWHPLVRLRRFIGQVLTLVRAVRVPGLPGWRSQRTRPAEHDSTTAVDTGQQSKASLAQSEGADSVSGAYGESKPASHGDGAGRSATMGSGLTPPLTPFEQVQVAQLRHERRIQRALSGEEVSPPLSSFERTQVRQRRLDARVNAALAGQPVDPPLSNWERMMLDQRRHTQRINRAMDEQPVDPPLTVMEEVEIAQLRSAARIEKALENEEKGS